MMMMIIITIIIIIIVIIIIIIIIKGTFVGPQSYQYEINQCNGATGKLCAIILTVAGSSPQGNH